MEHHLENMILFIIASAKEMYYSVASVFHTLIVFQEIVPDPTSSYIKLLQLPQKQELKMDVEVNF